MEYTTLSISLWDTPACCSAFLDASRLRARKDLSAYLDRHGMVPIPTIATFLISLTPLAGLDYSSQLGCLRETGLLECITEQAEDGSARARALFLAHHAPDFESHSVIPERILSRLLYYAQLKNARTVSIKRRSRTDANSA